MVNYHAGAAGVGIVNSSTVNEIVTGLFISKPPATSGLNLAASNASRPRGNCRLYNYQIVVNPQKKLDYIQKNPQKKLDYIQKNRNKKVGYRTFVTQSYNNIGVGNSFNALIYSGIDILQVCLLCAYCVHEWCIVCLLFHLLLLYSIYCFCTF